MMQGQEKRINTSSVHDHCIQVPEVLPTVFLEEALVYRANDQPSVSNDFWS